MSTPEQNAQLVPFVTLARGDQVLKREYPAAKFAIGTSAKASLQFQAEGVPDLHPLLAPSRNGVFVYVREGMHGTLTKKGRTTNIDDLIHMGVLPEKNGLHAISLDAESKIELNFGEHKIAIGFGPKPVEAAPPPKPMQRLPQRLTKGKLQLRPKFYFTEIPELANAQPIFYGSFAVVALVYIAMLWGLRYMVRYVPERDVLATPPPRVVKLIVPEAKEPEPVPEEAPQEAAPEEAAEDEKAKEEEQPRSAEEVRQEARQQVQKLGLVQMLATQGGGVSKDVAAVMNSLSNVFAAGPLTADASDSQAVLSNIDSFGSSGGIDADIASLKAVRRRNLKAGTEKVDNPVVSGEAAADTRRSYSAISNRVRQYMSGFKVVYKKLLRNFPSVQGKITFKWIIKADGSVSNVRIVNSAFGKHPDFEQDMKSRVEKMKFDPIPKGDVEVEFPFLFTPAS